MVELNQRGVDRDHQVANEMKRREYGVKQGLQPVGKSVGRVQGFSPVALSWGLERTISQDGHHVHNKRTKYFNFCVFGP